RPVDGVLLTFDHPETRLPTIDRLEGFHTGRSQLLPSRPCPGPGKWNRSPDLALRGGGMLDRERLIVIQWNLALKSQ
ncbi:MAG: hypothetical protein ACP5RC_08155, partial [Halothiobacillaceae bacterium]